MFLDFLISFVRRIFFCFIVILGFSCILKNSWMFFKFFFWFLLRCRGCKCFRLFVMFIFDWVVRNKWIYWGSLENWFVIILRSLLCFWYLFLFSLFIIIRIFFFGFFILLSGFFKSSVNSFFMFMLLSLIGFRFFESCFMRDFLYFGKVWLRWEVKDWSISWGFL